MTQQGSYLHVERLFVFEISQAGMVWIVWWASDEQAAQFEPGLSGLSVQDLSWFLVYERWGQCLVNLETT